jgi:hypothetical protein
MTEADLPPNPPQLLPNKPGFFGSISSSFIEGGSRDMRAIKIVAFYVGIPTAVYLSMRKNKKSKTWMWFSIPAAVFFYGMAHIGD